MKKEKQKPKVDVKQLIMQEFFDSELDDDRRKRRKEIHKIETEFCDGLGRRQLDEFESLMEIKSSFQCEVNEELIEFCLEFVKAMIR